MSRKMWRKAGLASVALAISGMTAPAQAAGLFDFLFGGFSEPSRPSYSNPPLQMRVNPKRKAKSPGGPTIGGGGGGGGSWERKTARQKSIDPVKNPGWYLDDPTLRRGDIVVLKGGKVLVFDGGRSPLSEQDFTSLRQSRLVSQAEREKIEKKARRDPSDDAPIIRAETPAAVAPAEPSAPREAALRPTAN